MPTSLRGASPEHSLPDSAPDVQAKCGGYLGRPVNIRIKDDDGTLVVSWPLCHLCKLAHCKVHSASA